MRKKRFIAVAIIAIFALTLVVLYLKSLPSPIDDTYYWEKYHNVKDHDACVSEFAKYHKYNPNNPRPIGLPCPGEPQ